MSREKTLVVILCMHRSGSSLTARLLERLGMSLGPFDLGEANEWNQYGHFEAQPFVLLNREIMMRRFGFEGDLPESAGAVRRFCESDGRWDSSHDASEESIARGRDAVAQLMASGPVCGFKDPRTVLVWPYWRRVFASMAWVRVVPLILVREPHEIAMSIFRRSQGERGYFQALDATAVHFRRMKEIIDQWSGPSAVVQFDPQVCAGHLRQAAELCGLTWSDSAFEEVYDASCRHRNSAVVDHPAQAAYEAFPGVVASQGGAENDRRILADTAQREDMQSEIVKLRREERDSTRQERDAARREIEELWDYIAALKEDSAELRKFVAATVPPLEARLAETSHELALIQSSRIWRVREALMHALRVGRSRAADRVNGESSSGGEGRDLQVDAEQEIPKAA
jgi:hypothetical protein